MIVHGEPGPGWVVEATVAAIAASTGIDDTVNELLLGEGHDCTLLLPVSALHGSGGSESPAGSTVALVLDSRNTKADSPPMLVDTHFLLFQNLSILLRLFSMLFLSCVKRTALPVSGLTTRAMDIKVLG